MISSTPYVENKKDGVEKVFISDGKPLSYITYKAGLQDGITKTSDFSGKETGCYIYVDGGYSKPCSGNG